MVDRVEQGFENLASWASEVLGRGITCALVIVLVTLGLVLLPIEQVNIAISVATLVLLFLLQSSQNRSDKAVHLKLDELVTRLNEPRDEIAGVEQETIRDIEALRSDEEE